MFDLGFGELLMIALVALVVLGPERLPKAARFAGLWVRRARAQWYSVKSELERELAADELKRNLDAARTATTDFEREVRTAVTDLDSEVRAKGEAARVELKALRDELAAAAEPDAGADAGADATSADDRPSAPGIGHDGVPGGPVAADPPGGDSTRSDPGGDDDGRR